MGGATNRMGGATSFPYPAPPSQVKSLLNATLEDALKEILLFKEKTLEKVERSIALLD